MEATISEVRAVPTPPAQGRWNPIGHGTFIDCIDSVLDEMDIEVCKKRYDLMHKGSRLFGTYDIELPAEIRDSVPGQVGAIIGFKGSIDKRYKQSAYKGRRTLVCSNGMMALETLLKVGRKNTTNIMSDLPAIVHEMLKGFDEYVEASAAQAKHLLSCEIDDVGAHDTICKAVRSEAITGRDVAPTIEQWHKPSYDFGDKTAWRLHNAFTTVQRNTFDVNPVTAASRTQALEGLFGDVFGSTDFTFGNTVSTVA